MLDNNLDAESTQHLIDNLPDSSSVGAELDTTLWHIPADGGLERRFHGQFLGIGTTYRNKDSHINHSGTYADPTTGERCNKCRWYELRLFFDKDSDVYVMLFAGRSAVPGETQRFRVETAVSAYEVIEILASREGRGFTAVTDNTIRLPAPALRALAQAAGFDRDIETAFNNRRSTV